MYDFGELGRFLYGRRHELGYTQAFVEETTGICEKTLQNIEYAKTATGIEFICLLFTMYGVPLEWMGNFFILDGQTEQDCMLVEFLRKRESVSTKEPAGVGK